MTEESEPGLKSSYPHLKSDASRDMEKSLHVSFDAVKEMHSPRFRAILRVTSGRRKRAPPDVKSFSHELNSKLPPGLPFHKFRGLRSPEDIMTVIRSKFNRLKEEINSELGVYAGDLVSILEKTTKEHPDWRVPLEDLLVIAQKCAEMSSDEFWLKCEGIVQNLDDRRQDLPMGSLKQAHTRILFILTRCTRLLQFQKEGIYGENDHILGRHQFSDLGFYPEQITSGDASQGLKSTFSAKAIKDKLIRKKLIEHGLSSGYFNQDFADRPLRYSAGTDSPGSRDRISSWKKLPSAVEKNKKISYNRKDELLETKKLDSLTQLDKRKLHPDEAVERPSETLDGSTDPGLKKQQDSSDDSGGLQGLSDVKPTMICRVCDFEIPTLYAEGHFKVCTIADKCDSKGLSIDERLEKVAVILEKLLESFLPRSSDFVAGNNGDARVSTSSTRDVSDDLTPLCSNLNHLSSTDKLDCFSEADSPLTTHHNGLLSIKCNRIYLTTFDQAAVPPSSRSITPTTFDQAAVPPSSRSITPRSPLLVPQTSQIASLLAGISAYSDLENLQQIKTLLDILRCIMGVKSNDYSSLENLSSYLEDLNALIEERNVDALVVETFGRRIEKLLQEKFVHLCGQIDDGNTEASSITADEDGTMENDMSRNSRPLSTKLKDRTSIEDFEIIKPISRGAFGRVFLAKKRITGDLFAIKVLKKADMIRKNAVESILAERNILISVRNPFVVRFYYSFTCRENLYLVMEYLNGGDLYSLLRNLGCLDEEMARTYIAEVVLALEYLHSLNVIHRDLKPDNLLIARDGHIKLTDFGLSKVGLINSTDDLTGPDVSIGVLLSENEPMPASLRAEKREQRRKQTVIGTPDYLAPEILLGMTHGQTADWWSVGVILFELLVGIPPFNAEHPQKIFDNIMNRDVPWPNVPEEIGYDAYDLINKLLIQNPLQRLGATGAGEVKSHPFFKDINWDMLARQKAAFIPSTECEDDTSYFACRHTWNSADEHIYGPPRDFDDMTDTGSLSCSTSPHSSDEDEDDDECVSMADFGAPSYVENYSFSNFSFKNLSQLAFINYDIMTKCSQDEPNASNS